MELPSLGTSCSMKECSQLDFLPLECAYCHATFCKEHHIAQNHSCPSVPDKQVSQDYVTQQSAVLRLSTYSCSFENCDQRNPMELLCSVCQKHFCPPHRFHGCNDPKKEARMAKREKYEQPKRQFRAAKEAVDKMVDASISKARTLTGTKLATANKIQLMRIKQQASGRRNIPMADRAYFLVHFKPVGVNEFDKKAVFVNKTWPMGRVVDMIAEQCKLFQNSDQDSPKLRVFDMDGRILSEDMTVTLATLLSDDVIIDGASLCLDFLETIVDRCE